MAHKDYYKTLGVEKGASFDEIKKAFRRLAHQHHPDKGGEEQKFKEVNEAYQVLSDEKKRAAYDTYGDAGAQGFGEQSTGFDPSQFGGFGAQGFDGVDLNDIFGEFFGGGRRSTPRKRRGRDISIDLELPFRDAIFGVTRKVAITKTSSCLTCGGSGAKSGATMKACATCHGKGSIEETKRSFLGVFSQMRECAVCTGTGKISEEKCASCKGRGALRRETEFTITVPAGVHDGETMRLSGAGEAVQNGTQGDLYMKIHVTPDKVFRREGQNLVMHLMVKFTDAILGVEQLVETLDGNINVSIPKGVSSGEVLRVKGKGVPTGVKHRGDLLVNIEVKTPTKLSRHALNLVEELKKEGV
jgi:molecular chaperone DnaJ